MEYYTYLIKCVPINKFYYGVRTANKVPPDQDLWAKYFTSSKTIKRLIETHGVSAFEVQIRHRFTSKIKALRWEYRVLQFLKKHSDVTQWLNRHFGSTYCVHNTPHTAETKAKMSEARKGRPRTAAQKDHMRRLHTQQSTQPLSEAHKAAISDGKRGKKSRPMSAEGRSNISASLKGRKRPERSVEWKTALGRAYEISTPEGEVLRVQNLQQFASQNGLTVSCLHRVLTGKSPNHKGFVVKPIR